MLKNLKKRINNRINQLEFSYGAIFLKSAPVVYIVGLDNVCNLKCPLCITGLRKQQKPPEYMDYKIFQQIIDKIKDYAIQVQLFNWGESLLHKDFNHMLEYCHQYNLNTQISSNLSLENIDDKLKAMVNNKLRSLIVSFDGTNQEDYSRYRINGNLDLVLHNINTLNKLKQEYNSKYPVISLQFLRNKYTKDQLEILEANYKQWGANNYYVCDMTTIFKDHDPQILNDWFDEEEIKRRKYFDIDISMHGKRCYFLYTTMIIEQDGTIPPCCFATDPGDDFGRWDNKKSISEMYNSEKFLEARKMFKYKNINPEISCYNCTVFLTYLAKKGK